MRMRREREERRGKERGGKGMEGKERGGKGRREGKEREREGEGYAQQASSILSIKSDEANSSPILPMYKGKHMDALR